MTPLTSKTFDQLVVFEEVAGGTRPAGLLEVVSPRESAFTYFQRRKGLTGDLSSHHGNGQALRE